VFRGTFFTGRGDPASVLGRICNIQEKIIAGEEKSSEFGMEGKRESKITEERRESKPAVHAQTSRRREGQGDEKKRKGVD